MDYYHTFGVVYLAQIISMASICISAASYNFAFVVVVYEFDFQFKMLLDELNEAFNYRHDKRFKKYFIDCIIHHQMIIR